MASIVRLAIFYRANGMPLLLSFIEAKVDKIKVAFKLGIDNHRMIKKS